MKIQFEAARGQSICGGLPVIEQLCRRFGLWPKLAGLRGIDPRKDTKRGFGPEVIVAQLLYMFTSGGVSLADAERLDRDKLIKRLAGLERFADASTVGEWLRAQSAESVAALWRINREFVSWTFEQADPARWTHAGRAEVFFDDTQLELCGPSFEGSAINYNGERALSWQTLWVGPMLADGELGAPGDVSGALPAMLGKCRPLWENRASDFLADSGSSAGKYLEAIACGGFTHWSVSYNKWTGVLDRTALAQPESAWSAPIAARWRDGSDIEERHAFIGHQPEGAKSAHTFAAVRFRKNGELFDQHRYIACEGVRACGAAGVFARHQLKGEKENLFKEVLRTLDLHHPPCESLIANAAFYALGALAYNLLIAHKLLHLPDDAQGWTLKTLLRQMILLPARLVHHARVAVFKVAVPGEWLAWWRRLHERLWPAPA